MAYEELKKYYYSLPPEAFQKIYMERFSSGQAVKLNFYIGDRQAFFLQNAEVYSLAYEIMKADRNIMILCTDLPGIALKQYRKKCLIDEIVLTNKIEGVHSSRKEIGEVLDVLQNQTKKKGGKDRFEGLVNKYFTLIKKEKIPLLTCYDVRNIYDEIFLDEIMTDDCENKPDGKIFRKGISSVYNASEKEIHRGVFPESRIIDKMDQSLAFLNDSSTEKLFRICIFHYLFEYIHPFYDGNGRLGRFIFSCGLSQELNPLIPFKISQTIKSNLSTYYKAFETCNAEYNCGDLTPFLIMQLKMLKNAMSDLLDSVSRRYSAWKNFEKILDSSITDKNVNAICSLMLQASLFSEKGITMSEITKVSGFSEYKVKNFMKEIPPSLVIVSRKGKTNYYNLDLTKLDKSK